MGGGSWEAIPAGVLPALLRSVPWKQWRLVLLKLRFVCSYFP